MGCVFGREVSAAKSVERNEGEVVRVERKVTERGESRNGVNRKDGNNEEEGTVRPMGEKRRSLRPNPRLGNPPKHVHGEQVAAGWPSWLSAVAGEAISGWTPRRADTFEKLDKIGQGTYSNVYKARDTLTGQIVALKKVRFDNLEPESVKFMAREILILRRLDHPNVVKLEGLVTSRMSCSLYLVFKYMEHDLAGLAASPGIKFTEPQVKCYMHQLLSGLEHCHNRNVLHRDIKGSNLLLDNEGILKIADFGLASFFDPNHKQPMTSRVVTLWYRPPELLLGATDYGVSVDLWSAGCILAELLAGKPIMPGRTEVEQLHKIFKLCGSPSEEYWKKSKLPHATIFKPQQSYKRCIAETFKDFPPSSLPLIETLLAIDPAERQTATAALRSEKATCAHSGSIPRMIYLRFLDSFWKHVKCFGWDIMFSCYYDKLLMTLQFFTTKPYGCEPSSLPKYPPSKEMDAKLRDEEARRIVVLAMSCFGHFYLCTHLTPQPCDNDNSLFFFFIIISNKPKRLRAAGKTNAEMKKVRSRDRAVRAMPAPEANAELQANLDRRRLITHANAKSKSEKFPPPHQDGTLGYPLGSSHHIDPVFDPPDVPFSSTNFSFAKAPIQTWSGPLVDPASVGAPRRKKHTAGDGHANSKSSKKDTHSGRI
ncbi:hypothetical protein Pint_25032 [Pistacia integerrima]|uniref:Uncharacterized protein n=1 Tax=Pistacia integerrima TaxID=434235 RepID=A0ACC0YHQ9_9ROSI|nr:hypothetical protein Pint_25032 [Pistacia integerrima]